MFAFRETVDLGPGASRVEVAFTDARLDLQGRRPGFAEALAMLVEAAGVDFARMNQVHGDAVLEVAAPHPDADAVLEAADALVATDPGVGLMVRVADCVPVLLAARAGDAADDAADDRAVVAAVHAGRKGVELNIVTRTVERMRDRGAIDPVAWIGPHVCGRCYEVPAAMRDEVATVVPAAASETSWGTPALDLGAGVASQLEKAGVTVRRVEGCTLEDDRFHSYRRDGADSGRLAGLVWIG